MLVVSTSYPLSEGGVSGIFVKHMADALSKHHDVSVLTPCGNVKTPVHDNVRCFRYGPQKWQRLAHEPGGIPVALRQNPVLWLVVPIFISAMLFSTLNRSRDAAIIHANWATTGLVCGLAGKMAGKPVVTTFRGADVAKVGSSWINRLIVKLTIQLSARVSTVSKPMQESLRAMFPELSHRITHIPNGVSESFFKIPVASINESTLRLVSIGGLIPRKWNTGILQAMDMLEVPVKLAVVGDGVERELLKRQAKTVGLEKQVTFLGIRAAEEIPCILNESDALVLASKSEGRPNVVVEAMASGKAVIASRLPGIEELIEHGKNGLLFEPGNAEALCEAIQLLIDNPSEVVRLGSAARKTIIDNGLSWDSCADNYTELYHQICKP